MNIYFGYPGSKLPGYPTAALVIGDYDDAETVSEINGETFCQKSASMKSSDSTVCTINAHPVMMGV